MDDSSQLHQEIKNWLTLYFLPGLGPKRLNDLHQYQSNPHHILQQTQFFPLKARTTWHEMQNNHEHQNWHLIKQNLDWIDPENLQTILHINDERYPKLLKQIDDPPILLWVKGDCSLLNNTQVAVVGSRACTASGIQITQQICKQLSEQNLQLISGGALGIDTIAHLQAIEQAIPTIAVLGTGVDGIYPKQNANLFEQIKHTGALISEFALNTQPNRFNFPKRNRIISALSSGVLVIEAHNKSGSLITARLALEQNKEVMAVPGSPLSEASQGCNTLISQGAHLIQNAQDVLNIISWRNQYPEPEALIPSVQTTQLTPQQNTMFQLINDVPQPIEILAHVSAIEFHQAQQLLFELEMKALISRAIGGFIRS